MSKRKRRWLSFLIWFGSTFLLMQILPSETKEGTKTYLYEWCSLVGIFVPIILAVAFNVYQKNILKKKAELEQKAKDIQRQIENAISVITEKIRLANAAPTFEEFIIHYDFAINYSKELERILQENNIQITVPSICKSQTLEAEFQWHLKDAIENERFKIASRAKKEYRNYPEGIQSDFDSFKSAIEHHAKKTFSEETKQFAQTQLNILSQTLGYGGTDDNYAQHTSKVLFNKNFDCLGGHEFEHWCAELLKKLNYQNVQVTPGSGDQGVDVLAEKDGIKYAIQCKCYSSDLGNTPVQEVNAGKTMYGCHVGVVMTNRYFTKGAKELAGKTGVLLWDRDVILSLVEKSTVQNI